MNEQDWSWFLERGRVVGGEPIADRRPQLLKRTERPVPHRADHGHGRVPHRVLHAGLVPGPFHPAGQHRRRVMIRQRPVSFVRHDLALTRMGGHAGLEVVGHQPRRGAAQPLVHRHMAAQPRRLPHIQRRLHECVPAERQARHEQVGGRALPGHRIHDLQCRPGPVHLDRRTGLALHPRRDAVGHHIRLIQLAETVAAHRRRPVGQAGIPVLGMRQPQRDAGLRQLAVHGLPIRLPARACVLVASREQQRAHLVVALRRDVRIRDAGIGRRPERLRYARTRYAERTRYGSARHGLRMPLQYLLRLDFPYHDRQLLSPHVPRMVKGA